MLKSLSIRVLDKNDNRPTLVKQTGSFQNHIEVPYIRFQKVKQSTAFQVWKSTVLQKGYSIMWVDKDTFQSQSIYEIKLQNDAMKYIRFTFNLTQFNLVFYL